MSCIRCLRWLFVLQSTWPWQLQLRGLYNWQILKGNQNFNCKNYQSCCVKTGIQKICHKIQFILYCLRKDLFRPDCTNPLSATLHHYIYIFGSQSIILCSFLQHVLRWFIKYFSGIPPHGKMSRSSKYSIYCICRYIAVCRPHQYRTISQVIWIWW